MRQFSSDLSWNSFFFVIFSARYFIPSSPSSIWHHFSTCCTHYTIYHLNTMCVFCWETLGLTIPINGPAPLILTRSQGKYTTTSLQLHRLTMNLTRLFLDIFLLSFIQNDWNCWQIKIRSLGSFSQWMCLHVSLWTVFCEWRTAAVD